MEKITYREWMDNIFIKHHITMGLSLEEIEELMENLNSTHIKKWLFENGYNASLEEYFLQMGI